ncbi:MAG: hypothetical protein V7L23_23160 [Nostoc sp.]|uniref:hypothetical protein n=1 Tax=Nostoc sp. TaxID=1180 RepID=UPI002FF1A6EF
MNQTVITFFEDPLIIDKGDKITKAWIEYNKAFSCWVMYWHLLKADGSAKSQSFRGNEAMMNINLLEIEGASITGIVIHSGFLLITFSSNLSVKFCDAMRSPE